MIGVRAVSAAQGLKLKHSDWKVSRFAYFLQHRQPLLQFWKLDANECTNVFLETVIPSKYSSEVLEMYKKPLLSHVGKFWAARLESKVKCSVALWRGSNFWFLIQKIERKGHWLLSGGLAFWWLMLLLSPFRCIMNVMRVWIVAGVWRMSPVFTPQWALSVRGLVSVCHCLARLCSSV